MNRWVYVAAVVLLLAVSVRAFVDYTASITYIAKTDGYAAAKAKYTARAPKVSDQIAHSICSGLFAADAATLFDPSMQVTQAYLDEFTAAAGREGRTCVEEQYLGSVQNADGSSDDIYRVVTNKKAAWYAISIHDGLVVNIQ